ncbi:MAG: hypothetical protein ACLPY5_13830 [Candidatus Bathyarchaeia archaeon]
MHEYDDKWQCKCGFRLITDLDSKSGWVQVKACVSSNGKIKPLGADAELKEKPRRVTGNHN